MFGLAPIGRATARPGRLALACLAATAAIGAAAPTAGAARPSDDDFAAATTLTGASGTSSNDNRDATREVGEPVHGIHGSKGDRSVWYLWEAPSTGTATFHLTGEWSFQNVDVYTGSSLATLIREDANSRYFSNFRFHAVAGTTYRIAVSSYSGQEGYQGGGPFTLEYYVGAPPPNDDFASAEVLTGADTSTTGDNSTATIEPGEPRGSQARSWDGGGPQRTIWYAWTAPSSGAASLDTAGSDHDTSLAVFTGTAVDDLSLVAEDNPGDWKENAHRTLSFNAVAGTTYRIQLDTRVVSERGTSKLALKILPAPANDDFAAAGDLGSVTSLSTQGRNDGATREPGEPDHAANTYWGSCSTCKSSEHSVWYRWKAPKRGSLVIRVDTAFFVQPVAYTGSAVDDLTPVALQPQSPNPGLSQIRVRVEKDVTYRLAVSSRSAYAAGDFGLSLALSDLPPNDDFADATLMTGMDWNEQAEDVDTNVNATQEPGEPVHAGNKIDPSVWYRWTAPVTGRVELNAWQRSISPVVAVYTGNSVAALTAVPSTRGPYGNETRFWAVAGTTYRIAVDGTGGQQGTFAVVLHQIAQPANDNFGSATQLSGDNDGDGGRTAGATKEAREPAHAGKPGGNSIWYRWTAPEDGELRVSGRSHNNYALLGVYTGSAVDALTEVASAAGADMGTEVAVTISVSGGTTYRIALDDEHPEGAEDGSWSTWVSTAFMPTATHPDPDPDPDPPALTVNPSIASQHLEDVLSRGLSAKASCNMSCSVRFQVLIEKGAAQRLGLEKAEAARPIGTATATGGQKVRITLKLSKSVRKKLRDERTLPLRVIVGARHSKQRANRAVTLKLRRR